MEISHAINSMMHVLPEQGELIDLEGKLSSLKQVYEILKDENSGASFEFRDPTGKRLGYATEMNPGKSYGHDLVYAFLEAGAELTGYITKQGLPHGIDMEVARLFLSETQFNPDSGLDPKTFNEGISAKIYDKKDLWHNRNLWQDFTSTYLDQENRMNPTLLGKGIVLLNGSQDLTGALNKAITQAGFDPKQIGDYDVAVSPIKKQIVY
ncbi:hypothetical protein ISS07_01530 [Candidatus Woesearchaeota archaeon]|nr:hypothetical protein [Candidatus Woesearchaeota archaeon]